MARKIKDRAATSGPTSPLHTTAGWAKLVLDSNRERKPKPEGKWQGMSHVQSTLGLPSPVSFLIAKLGWEQLTAPLARKAFQLLEAAA